MKDADNWQRDNENNRWKRNAKKNKDRKDQGEQKLQGKSES